MTTDAEIDAKLARVAARLGAERGRVRDRLAKDPALLEMAELAKQTFGARLTWLRDADGEIGTEPEHGTVPAPYRARRVNAKTGKVVFSGGHE